MASISKINDRWRALIRIKGHKHISRWFDTKAAATVWAVDTERQMRAGVAPSERATLTVGGLIERFRKMREASRPIMDTSNEHYTLKQLTRTLGEIEVARLTVDDLIGWASKRRDEGAGPYTINLDLSRLGTVFRYAGDGVPDVVGQARPKLKYLGLIGGGGKRERRPTEDESARVLEWLEANRGRIYADFARFAALTAMRRGEVSALLWADVDEKRRMVLIRDRKDPRSKQGNDQWIPLLGDAWPLLQAQPKGERVFPVHPQTMTKYFTEACRALGVPDLHLHDLRHEGISRMFEQGFDIPQVSIVSGHRDWRHLRRYTQLKPESLHDSHPDTAQRPGSPRTASRRQGKS